MAKLEQVDLGSSPSLRRWRYSFTLEAESPPKAKAKADWHFWIQVALKILGIAAMLAVGVSRFL